MRLHKTTEVAASQALLDRLRGELMAGRDVTWLLSGGSNIKTAVDIMARLDSELTQNLTISLIDERYGPVGHADSNARQLLDAGFEAKQAAFWPVLRPGISFEETTLLFADAFGVLLENSDVVIGQLGLGDDGHIAGIKPGSPAVGANGWAVNYDWSDYRRITLTFEALRRLTASYTLVWGDNKKSMLHRLRDQELSLDEQPAQILKQLSDATIYNDQVEEEG